MGKILCGFCGSSSEQFYDANFICRRKTTTTQSRGETFPAESTDRERRKVNENAECLKHSKLFPPQPGGGVSRMRKSGEVEAVWGLKIVQKWINCRVESLPSANAQTFHPSCAFDTQWEKSSSDSLSSFWPDLHGFSGRNLSTASPRVVLWISNRCVFSINSILSSDPTVWMHTISQSLSTHIHTHPAGRLRLCVEKHKFAHIARPKASCLVQKKKNSSCIFLLHSQFTHGLMVHVCQHVLFCTSNVFCCYELRRSISVVFFLSQQFQRVSTDDSFFPARLQPPAVPRVNVFPSHYGSSRMCFCGARELSNCDQRPERERKKMLANVIRKCW